jgi:hypothetical protein
MKPEYLDAAFDFVLLIGILTFGSIIALGKVEQATSHGLTDVIGILAVLAGNRSARWRPLIKEPPK